MKQYVCAACLSVCPCVSHAPSLCAGAGDGGGAVTERVHVCAAGVSSFPSRLPGAGPGR